MNRTPLRLHFFLTMELSPHGKYCEAQVFSCADLGFIVIAFSFRILYTLIPPGCGWAVFSCPKPRLHCQTGASLFFSPLTLSYTSHATASLSTLGTSTPGVSHAYREIPSPCAFTRPPTRAHRSPAEEDTPRHAMETWRLARDQTGNGGTVPSIPRTRGCLQSTL